MTSLFSPLEQFDIFTLIPIVHINNTYLCITNSTLFLLLSLSTMLVCFYFVDFQLKIVPTK